MSSSAIDELCAIVETIASCKHCGARLGDERGLRTGGAPAGPDRG